MYAAYIVQLLCLLAGPPPFFFFFSFFSSRGGLHARPPEDDQTLANLFTFFSVVALLSYLLIRVPSSQILEVYLFGRRAGGSMMREGMVPGGPNEVALSH